MGRPLVLACSADLADSTAISGFAKDFEGKESFGWYERNSNTEGSLLPQQITEFTNAGLVVGAATVNMSATPEDSFMGYWGSCSTYGSFSYLKYGMMRLFSQLAQDCELKVGKVIWVAGHSGPETAEDSRTHFGIFSPVVTQLFPDGHDINLRPWEHNEAAPALPAALKTDVPPIAPPPPPPPAAPPPPRPPQAAHHRHPLPHHRLRRHPPWLRRRRRQERPQCYQGNYRRRPAQCRHAVRRGAGSVGERRPSRHR